MGGTRTMLKAVLLLVCLCMAGAQQFNSNNPVIFPGDSSRQPPRQQASPVGNNRQTGIGNKPRCADGLEENAPCIDDQDYTANIRDRFRFLLGRFRGNEIVTNEVFQDLSKPEEINITIDVDIKDSPFTFESLCASRETIIYPKRAKTQKNEWVFVLSQGKHRQAVKVEKCSNNNGPCRLGAAGTEVNTVCRQKYIYKKLLVMNGAGTDIVPESVLMPSCCVCYIRKERNNRGPGGDFDAFGFRQGGGQFSNRNVNNRGNNVGSNNRQGNSANSFQDRRVTSGFSQG